MNWSLLSLLTVVYITGLLWFQRRHWSLALYIWQAFGLAFLLIHLAVLLNWHVTLAALEASQIAAIVSAVGVPVQVINDTTLLIPDATGWSGLRIGVESSTLIEIAVLSGLLLFYPKRTSSQRGVSLAIGFFGTYLLNLLRLFIIIAMILLWGKPAVAVAHTLIGRLVYFVGVVLLYWFLMTKPTVRIVYDVIRTSGRLER
jgi:exosortase/archaeosortase family protein